MGNDASDWNRFACFSNNASAALISPSVPSIDCTIACNSSAASDALESTLRGVVGTESGAAVDAVLHVPMGLCGFFSSAALTSAAVSGCAGCPGGG